MSLVNAPLKRKLTMTMLLVSGVALLLACSAFVVYDLLTFRHQAEQQVATLARVIATNSTAALAFENQQDAAETLSSLRAEPRVLQAALYDRLGRLFATYPSGTQGLPAVLPTVPDQEGFDFQRVHLTSLHPVLEDGNGRLGTLYLRTDLGAAYQRLQLYGGIAALVLAVSFLAAYLLSSLLQRQISRPVMALAETARAVSDQRDYSVRAPVTSQPELGVLTDAFNQMLSQVQLGQAELQQAYDDLRRSQLTIAQQERLRALGQMASGIAHDINNALSPVSLYTDTLLTQEPALSERGRNHLVTIQRAIEDVAHTIARMREFYRPRESPLAFALLDLNSVALQAIDLTRARWSNEPHERGIFIDVRTELVSQPLRIVGSDGEIRDALVNLIFNAVDAMPQGGTLTLRTRMSDSPPRAWIEVSDTGLGMDEETRRQCLEPFFTTKGERGTGMGLAMVYGMTQRHHGEVEIDSKLGEGTTVRLAFQLAAGEVATAGLAMPPQVAEHLHLLVIDDDPLLVQSLRDTLESEGHRVTAANGGQAGIDAFMAVQTRGESVDAVITDLGMPHLDGRAVAAAVKAISPDTPVVLLTGWGHRILAENDVPPDVDRVLSKPPRLHQLRTVLAEVTAG